MNQYASTTFICLLFLIIPFFHVSIKNTTTLDVYFQLPI